MVARLALAALVLAAALAVLVPPCSACAQSREVVQLFEQGLAAYREGRFEEAAGLFERAHAIEAIPDLTYNRARALENLGRLEEAAAAYRLLLEENPQTDDRRGIEERIRVLDARVGDAQRLEEERARLEEERARLEEERAARAAPPAASEGSGPWPWIVAGTGAALIAAGAITGGLALDAHDRAASRELTQPESASLESQSNDLALATTVLFVAGGAIAGAGLVWGIVEATTARPGPSAAVTLLPGGLSVRGTF